MKLALTGTDRKQIAAVADWCGGLSTADIIQTEPWDAADVPAERVLAVAQACDAAVLLKQSVQLSSPEKELLRRLPGEQNRPVLILVDVTQAEQTDCEELRSNIRAELESMGMVGVPVEFYRAETGEGGMPITGATNGPKSVCDRIDVFVTAATTEYEAPGTVLCSKAEQLKAHIAYHKRFLEQKTKFAHLSNVLEFEVTARVTNADNGGMRATISRIRALRLEVPEDLISELPILSAREIHAGDKLVPEMVRDGIVARLELWLRKKHIGSFCAVDLTLQCPNHMAKLGIQQSPILVEVAP